MRTQPKIILVLLLSVITVSLNAQSEKVSKEIGLKEVDESSLKSSITAVHCSAPDQKDGAIKMDLDFNNKFVQPNSVTITDGRRKYENGKLAPGTYMVVIEDGLGAVISEETVRIAVDELAKQRR